MGQKKKQESSEFFEAWAKCKVDILSSIFDTIDDVFNPELLGIPPSIAKIRWKHEWPLAHMTRNEYGSWKDFLNARNKEINTFMETGNLEFDPIPFVDIVGGPGMFQVLKQDCIDLTKIIENSSHVKDKISFLYSIEKTIPIIRSALDKLEGRLYLKWDQKEQRLNSGIGQKKAQAERQAKLAESLRQYEKDDYDEIRIKKGDFCKFLDQAFVGAEDYPRHPSTIKNYKEASEKILGKKIIFKK